MPIILYSVPVRAPFCWRARSSTRHNAVSEVLDATVERNAYGRQIDSTILTAETSLSGGPLEMVFIRAPRIVATGEGVEVLARREGYAVLVRQGGIMAATFHPELSADRRVHKAFVEIVSASILV